MVTDVTPPITLADQVKEAGREVGMRKAVYPRQVGQGRMSQTEASQRIATMEAIYATLKWLERQEGIIKELAAVEKSQPELKGTHPLVLYFGNETDRAAFLAIAHEAKPGMIARAIPEAKS